MSAVLVFLHGDYRDGGEGHGWVAGLRLRTASVRGWLWEDRRRRRGLLPDEDADRVEGWVVDLDPARLQVVDLFERAEGIVRRPVTAAVGVTPVRVEAWVLPDATTARRAGWRPLGGRWGAR